MATVNLGKIKLKWRGTYAGGTAYTPDDVVYYVDGSVGSSYICVTATTGNAPSSGGTAHSSWNYLAKGQATSPTTTQGDVIVRGASADDRLAIGSAGQVLKVNSSANGLEYGTGFAGTHYLAYSNRNRHGTQVTVNGNPLSNGTSDGQRDCILINNGQYHTITPGHADDIIVMSVSSLIYVNMTSGGTYWGLGMQSATDTGFTANRNMFYLSGQHAWGNGASGQGDHYENSNIVQQFRVGDINLSAGTTYYIRGTAQIHSPNRDCNFNNHSGVRQESGYTCWLRHYKKNV